LKQGGEEMINGTTRISLRAARANANMTQAQAADKLSEYFGMKISRQRIMEYEKHPAETPPAFGQGFASIYNIPLEGISFTR
jgi:hypothetical protein